MKLRNIRLAALLLALLLSVGCAGPADAAPTAPQPPAPALQTPAAAPQTSAAASQSPAPASQAPAPLSPAPAAASGPLHVSGAKLVNAAGQPVQLRGVSTHGLAWYPQYVNQDCFNDLKRWGASVVRLAMYTAEYGGYCAGGDQAKLKDLIRKGVQYASNAGLYAIVDWHILSDGDPNTYLEQAKAFFREMSADLSGYDNVLYEICNEPNGGGAWSRIKAYAQQIIPVIRENDPDAVIIVGTPNWSQRVNEAAADPITGWDNIMYTFHFYAATHGSNIRQLLINALDAGLPVFVTEYGVCAADGNGAIDEAQAAQWIDTLDRYGVSYVAWNLSNKAETSALLKPSCAKTSGFTADDLSSSGQWLYKLLSSKAGPHEDSGAAGFKDVKPSDWFAPAVEYVVERGLMKGTGGGVFSPGSTVTRAQLVTILGRLSGADVDGGVPWYKKAMDWGMAQSITDGTNPDGAITREQFVAMLYRNADRPAADLSVLDRFPDASDIHNWPDFRAAMAWAIDNGIIGGSGSGLEPRRAATRAEAAAMLQNFCTLSGPGGTPSGGGAVVSVTPVSSWEQDGVPVRQYSVTVTNASDTPCDGWAVELEFDGPITLSGSWNGVFTVSGSTLRIASVDYNGALAPGASASDVGFIVSGGAYVQ